MKLRDVLIDKIYEINDNNIKKLKKNMSEGGADKQSWAFCLGAGVSVSCGFPNWTKLLAMISGQILNSYSPLRLKNNELLNIIVEMIASIEKDEIFANKLKAAEAGSLIGIYEGTDPLELAEYIRTQVKELNLGGNADENTIGEILRTYIRGCYKVDRWNDDLIEAYQKSTLAAVVELMEKKKIRRAITYNYDDLLETALRKDGKNVESIVPGDQKEFVEEDKSYKIYHCHGLIPVNPEDDLSECNSRKIILTESSYYNEESNDYSLSNVLQAYSMNYCNLLYIGFSGADYTFRRIIRGLNRAENKIKHNIFFCVDDIFNMVYKSRAEEDKGVERDDYIRQIKEQKREFERLMINQILVSKTLYWEEKGMNVIWSTHEELAEILKNL